MDPQIKDEKTSNFFCSKVNFFDSVRKIGWSNFPYTIKKFHSTKNVDIDVESNIFLEALKNLTDLRARKVGDLMKYLDQHNLAYNP